MSVGFANTPTSIKETFGRRILSLTLLSALGAGIGFSPRVYAEEPLPLETFFKDYLYDDMVISPSGRYLAAIYPSNGTKNLAIVDLKENRGSPLTGLRKPSEAIWVSWVSEDRLVYGLRESDKLGHEPVNFVGIDRNSGNHRRIGGAGLYNDEFMYRYMWEQIVSWLPDDPDHILIQSNAAKPDFPEVYRVNVHSGRRRLVARPAGRRSEYVADHTGVVRVATSTEENLDLVLLYRSHEDAPWQELARSRFDRPHLDVIGFAADNRTLYVLSTLDRDKHALYTYDPESRRLGELLFEHPAVDIEAGVFSADRQSLIGVTYTTDRRQTHYFDTDTAAAVEAISEAFPGSNVRFVNRTRDDERSVVRVNSDRTPGTFYLFDSQKLTVTELAAVAPWIDPAKMPPTRSFQFDARDGLGLNGFVTLPIDYEGGKLPTVVLPHGGPYGVRDRLQFDPEVKFLADRGYAVVQVNFRGSYGFGLEYQQAGVREFGRKMQDDVTDATHWSIEQGFADPERICIYGASYGGYAALMGVIREPGLYRCAISYAGVTDVQMMFKNKAVKWGGVVGDEDAQRFWEIVIGDPNDTQAMRALSPVHNVAAIDVPVFIIHGGEDYVVHVDHAAALRKELERLGKPFEWLLKQHEGHGFYEQANRIELYGRIEQFLAGQLAR